MTPAQCRMARTGISISVRELAERAHVSHSTITRFEAGQNIPDATMGLIQKILEQDGVEFVADASGLGVWLRSGPAAPAT